MVIRNPYGFIAKHYKLINLLLLVPLLYLALKFGDVASFFRDYVKNNYTTVETGYAVKYVTGLTFLVLIVMLIINAAIYIICMTKKKNISYFLIASGYYAVLLLLALFFRVTMENMQLADIDQTFANFVRDCANLSFIPAYFLLAVGLSKGVGFNVKTLRFDNNSELIIAENDDENIELRLGNEDNSLKKNVVHLIRELKYYVLENKFVFTCFAVLLLIVIGVSLFLNFQVYNKTYSLNQAFSMEGFTLSLKDSYITNVDYQGKVISVDKYYLAIKLGIINNGRASSIDSSNFRIYLDNESLYPSYDRASRFIDIAKVYQGEVIPNVKDYAGGEYVFVYELNKEQVKNSYQMRILNGLTQKENKLIKRYKKINIKPTNLLKEETYKGELKIGSEISFKNSMLQDTLYKLNSIEIVDHYIFDKENCIGNDCNTVTDTAVASPGNALVVIKDELKWDESTDYYKNSNKDFYGDFVTLSYQYNLSSGVEINESKNNVTGMKNVTPAGLNGTKIYEVSGNILRAKKIDMIIKIRNKKYVLSVK